MIDGKVAQANGRLKAGKVGVAIEIRGDRLCLRATFPPRPGSSATGPHQQRLSLKVHANPAGLKIAEQEARRIGVLLDSGSFDWAEFLGDEAPDTCVDWIVKYEQDYFSRHRRSPATETTWQTDYQRVFDALPQSHPLTLAVCEQLIRTKAPDSRTRRRYVDALSRLCRFAGLEPDFQSLRGNYSALRVVPRELPLDADIDRVRLTIPNPEWRRLYGLLAVYGLRPHEAFSLDLSQFPLARVGEATKTGSRIVYPFYPEWAETWDLVGSLPSVTGKNNTALGHRVNHAFQRYQIPFPPYHLRHCWAVRSLEFGLDLSLAAAQMGHSVSVHSQIYHAWISEDLHARAYRSLIANPDRPRPPGLNLD